MGGIFVLKSVPLMHEPFYINLEGIMQNEMT